jgi:hypothetical protein
LKNRPLEQVKENFEEIVFLLHGRRMELTQCNESIEILGAWLKKGEFFELISAVFCKVKRSFANP